MSKERFCVLCSRGEEEGKLFFSKEFEVFAHPWCCLIGECEGIPLAGKLFSEIEGQRAAQRSTAPCRAKGKRSRGYHWFQEKKHRQKAMELCLSAASGYFFGSPQYEWLDGKWQPVGKYVRRFDMVEKKRFCKKVSRRKVRRTEELPQRNGYQKVFDYSWELY